MLLARANPNHDSKGQFASAPSAKDVKKVADLAVAKATAAAAAGKTGAQLSPVTHSYAHVTKYKKAHEKNGTEQSKADLEKAQAVHEQIKQLHKEGKLMPGAQPEPASPAPTKPAKAPKEPKAPKAAKQPKAPVEPAPEPQKAKDGVSPHDVAKAIKKGKDPEAEKAVKDWLYSSNKKGVVGFEKINANPDGEDATRVVGQFAKLEKSPGETYRAISFTTPKQQQTFISKLKVGGTVPIKGALLSTSKSKEFVEGFTPLSNGVRGLHCNNRVHFVINGKSGRDIAPLAGAVDHKYEAGRPNDQKEVVYIKGTKFKVSKIDIQSHKDDGLDKTTDYSGKKVSVKGAGKLLAKFDHVTTVHLDEQ